MNELAHDIALDVIVKNVASDDWVFTDSEFKQFVNQLVSECAKVCKDTAENQFNPLFSRESDGAMVCYRKIKEHFGVDNEQ